MLPTACRSSGNVRSAAEPTSIIPSWLSDSSTAFGSGLCNDAPALGAYESPARAFKWPSTATPQSANPAATPAPARIARTRRIEDNQRMACSLDDCSRLELQRSAAALQANNGGKSNAGPLGVLTVPKRRPARALSVDAQRQVFCPRAARVYPHAAYPRR